MALDVVMISTAGKRLLPMHFHDWVMLADA